jgi:hypothetical protein
MAFPLAPQWAPWRQRPRLCSPWEGAPVRAPDGASVLPRQQGHLRPGNLARAAPLQRRGQGAAASANPAAAAAASLVAAAFNPAAADLVARWPSVARRSRRQEPQHLLGGGAGGCVRKSLQSALPEEPAKSPLGPQSARLRPPRGHGSPRNKRAPRPTPHAPRRGGRARLGAGAAGQLCGWEAAERLEARAGTGDRAARLLGVGRRAARQQPLGGRSRRIVLAGRAGPACGRGRSRVGTFPRARPPRSPTAIGS